MLASIGVASQGFDVTYVRCEPDQSSTPRMMPEYLEGVDVVLASIGNRSGSGPPAARPSGGLPDWLKPDSESFVIFDMPLPSASASGGSVDDDLISFVTRSVDLRNRRAPPGRRLLYCGYDGLGRGDTRRSWDNALNGLRLDLPALSAAEIQSLLNGAPLVRTRAVAHELGAELIEATARDDAASPFAWPSASFSHRDRRVRYNAAVYSR